MMRLVSHQLLLVMSSQLVGVAAGVCGRLHPAGGGRERQQAAGRLSVDGRGPQLVVAAAQAPMHEAARAHELGIVSQVVQAALAASPASFTQPPSRMCPQEHWKP